MMKANCNQCKHLILPSKEEIKSGFRIDGMKYCTQSPSLYYDRQHDNNLKCDWFGKVSSYESFKKYQLPADSLEDFLERYTKPSAHRERGEDHVKARIESHTEWLNKCGFTFITRHDSKTGEHISYYGNKEEL